MPDSVDLSDLMDGGGTATRSTLGDKVPAPPKSSPPISGSTFSTLMDKTFGRGHWRQTGGFRSVDREEELRAEGAGTVKPGHMSMHSVGDEDAPGARDVVVDGLTPDQAASKLKGAGVKFRHVFPEGTRGQQGAHLHIDTELADAPGESVPTGPPPILGPGPVDLSDLVDVGPKKPTPLKQARDSHTSPYLPNIADVPKDIGHQFMEGVRANQQEAKVPYSPAGEDMPIPLLGATPRALKQGVNTLSAIAAPISGVAESVIGRPVANIANAINDKFHIAPKYEADPEAIGNLATMGLGGLGEVNEARAAAKAGQTVKAFREAEAARAAAPRVLPQSNALKAQLSGRDPEYAARVDRLNKMDVDLLPGQVKGGEAKVREQQDTSSRYKGEAIREKQQDSLKSYNRAGYNQALAPIGERYNPKGPVGRAGIDEVGRRIGAVYDRILPQARLKADQQVADRISEIKEDHEGMLGPYKGALDSIIQSRVIKRLDADHSMDGRTFKEVESELSGLSRKYHQSQDGAQHILGDAIDELNGALRDNMERNSPEHVRPELKRANSAWAAYKRLEGASERRPTSLGIFTPGDLEQAVKIGNRGGSFARGKALLGQFADDGQAVLGNIVPDSGTAGRLNRSGRGIVGAAVGGAAGHAVGGGLPGEIVGAALGGAADRYAGSLTNSLARHLLSRESARATGRPVSGHNYLQAARQRALSSRVPIAIGADGQIEGGQR